MKQKPIKHLGSVNTHSHTHIGICMCRLKNNNNCKKNNNTPSRASLVVRFISSCSWATALACLWFSPYMTVCQCVCVCASMYVCLPKDFNRRKLLQVVHPIFMAPNVANNKTFPGPDKPDQLGHVYIQHRLVGGGCGRVHRA